MPDPTVPPFHGNINFNAQHSPMGAFMSFTCGHFGTRGGFGLQIGKPGNQDLYIGVKDGDRFSDAPLKCLPFYQGAVSTSADAFLVEQSGPAEQNVKPRVIPYHADQIKRHYGWASDRWVTDDLEFTLYTPFGTVPSPDERDWGSNWTFPQLELRYRLLPATFATFDVDNSKGEAPRTAFFACNFNEPGARLLDRGIESGVGFALGHRIGIAARLIQPDEPDQSESSSSYLDKLFLFARWTPEEGLRNAVPHLLGTAPGIGFEVPAGRKLRMQLVLGCFLSDIVTTRMEGRYWYTRYYGDLLDVLNRGFHHFDQALEDAETRDAELLNSGLSPDRQFLIAHATRSYYGSTQLLDVAGQPFWVVNEGEYCMMNTLDLSVDHMFWELKHNPWVVRNVLDNFVKHFSYHDQLKAPKKDTLAPGGISFCHDMGVHNNFSPFGHSSYELPNLTGCFSYMTAEQLCNWCLMAATYVITTQDHEWASQNVHLLVACVQSLVNRGGESGFVQFDSSRCESGSEITTYDSLDHSLAQTRNNVYMAVKCWASYLGLAMLLEKLGQPEAARARKQVARIEQVLAQHVGSDGVFPAVFETDDPGYASRILPAVEGLMYPLAWGALQPDSPLFSMLKRHARELLLDPQRRNFFPDGGIRLSSTSDNSWMSKIAIFQHVARRVLHLDDDPKIKELFQKADAAHVKWQTDGSAYWACSDQMVNGVAKGSRYYPRIITAALWMDRPNS
jgi:hypothetical protein